LNNTTYKSRESEKRRMNRVALREIMTALIALIFSRFTQSKSSENAPSDSMTPPKRALLSGGVPMPVANTAKPGTAPEAAESERNALLIFMG
jgi:hypothetical protein